MDRVRCHTRHVGRRLTPLLLALFGGVVAHGQGPVLHEYVPDVREDEAMFLTAGEAEPAAIVYDGEVIPAPRGGALREDERPMTAEPGDGMSSEEPGHRSPTFRPDRVTALEGTLGYYTVFTPTIAPFKRVTALDSVKLAPDDGRTPVLAVSDPSTTPVPVVGATAPPPDGRERDRFWGSVVLDFSAGSRVPLPSVSPESRILTLRTEPEAPIRIERDAADNFFAVAAGPLPSPQVRLTFLTDAPRPYFNAPLPEVASDALADDVPPIPDSIRQRAVTFAAELGLRRGMPLPTVLEELTRHFRAFEESDEPPDDTGDIYLDLCRGGKGVCRHRAYGFAITAMGLGIPARFVMNEAHAWVEVRMPSVGWMRIDLGGAAQGLEAHDASERPVYRPVHPDPLPRPAAYERSYSQARQRIRGLRSGSTPRASRSDGASGGTAENGAPRGETPTSGPGAPSPSAADDASGPRDTLRLTVDRSRYDVFRGRSLEVTGRVTSRADGEGVPGLRLEVLLSGEREFLLGVTVSREHGYYRGTFGVPPDVDVGEYLLVVRTPGDEAHMPATAR